MDKEFTGKEEKVSEIDRAKAEEMGRSVKERIKKRSLTRRLLRGVMLGCLLLGLAAQLTGTIIHAYALVRMYSLYACDIASYASMMLELDTDDDLKVLADEIMEKYRSLSQEERDSISDPAKYNELFSDIDMGEGSEYQKLVALMQEFRRNSKIDNLYLGMIDPATKAVVYIADHQGEKELHPGAWSSISDKRIDTFLYTEVHDEYDLLYDIQRDKKLGLICTGGVQLKDQSGRIYAFIFVDVTLEIIISDMIGFVVATFIAILLIAVLVTIIMTKYVKKTVTKPINAITDAATEYVIDKQLHRGNNDHFSKLGIKTKDEIENLSEVMGRMEKDLVGYEEHITRIAAERERISAELNMATQIQVGMLPHIFPPFPERKEFEIYASMKPAKEVGGDFYDFFLIDDDHLCLVIADVSGKGVPAALFMMVSKVIIQSYANICGNVSEVLERANEAILSDNQVEMFVTVWIGILEISTGILKAANAGHEFPTIKKPDGPFELLKDKHGFVVGGMEGVKYREYEVKLEKGSKLFVYTDGIPEATDKDNNMFGTDRMLEALNKEPGASTEKLIENVTESVADFVKDAVQFDDMTMICFEYRGPEE